MLHDDVLKQLFPVELAVSPFPVEGAALDRAGNRIDLLLPEMFPGSTVALLDRWEALYEIIPPEGATVQQRQAALLVRYRTKGDIKKPAFILLAAALGYTIRIDDYLEAQADWLCADDDLWEEPFMVASAGLSLAGDYLAQADVILPFIWEVVVEAVPPVIPSPTIEELINDLKPAHVHVNYRYPEA